MQSLEKGENAKLIWVVIKQTQTNRKSQKLEKN